jgi:dTDP-4-dehydrorhamnose reductase
MKLLLVGAESQVGRVLVSHLAEHLVSVEFLDSTQALTAPLPSLVKQYADSALQFVVNVDHIDGFHPEGHTQKELEERHVLLPQQLAKLAEELEIPLLQLSDYQVFSGNGDLPYREEDEPHSQTLYGVTRWQGELSVQRFAQRVIILRVGTLFCEQGKNLLVDLLNQWKQGEARELSTLLQFSPTPTHDVVRVIYAMLQQLACDAPVWGIYHYCSADVATPYDFAEVLLAARTQFIGVENEIRIKPVQTALPKNKNRLRSAASMPVNTVLVCEKILNTFGIRQRPWRGELTRMIERMSQEKSQPMEKTREQI